jgi:beta-N-acetylhexosaminidase
VTDLETLAARLLIVGFPGRTLDPELERLIARGVSGVILFSRNVGDPREVLELTTHLKRFAARRLLVSVDQEGGKVARLRSGFTPLPPLRALGETCDAELARAFGALIGRELAAVGIDWDFAPVLDVDTNPENPVIGERSLSRDPETVARLGVALARGFLDSGVAPCAKHFPGHGDTRQDSHFDLPRLPHDRERLAAVELVPFRAAIAAGVPAIMTAHVVFEALEPSLPASLSERVVGGLLRTELGYSGVVVTDDLEMKAIADHHDIADVVVRGLNAGIDAFLCCLTADLAHRAISAIVTGVNAGSIPRARLEVAAGRMHAFAERFASPPERTRDLSVLACDAHLRLVERLRNLAEKSA